jgi:dienelactone hydrolase
VAPWRGPGLAILLAGAALVAGSCSRVAFTARPTSSASPPGPTLDGGSASPSTAPRPTVGPIDTCITNTEASGAVVLHSDSGADLRAVVLGSGTVGVVLAHEAHGTLCEWLPYGRRLASLGYRVIAVDLNGFGSSPPSPGSPSRPGQDLDVMAAAAELRDQGVARVVLIGANLGGIAALVAATRIQPPVSGIVDMSGQIEMGGLDATAAAAVLHVPVLYVMSSTDEYRQDVRAVYAATRIADRQLEVVDAIAHGVSLLDPAENAHADRLASTIERFISTHIGG